MSDLTNKQRKDLIEDFCESHMLKIESWDEEHENGLTANLGTWRVYHDDYADQGFYVDDTGKLEACVVGAPEYGNVRVSLSFVPDGMDGGNDIPGDDVLSVLDPA